MSAITDLLAMWDALPIERNVSMCDQGRQDACSNCADELRAAIARDAVTMTIDRCWTIAEKSPGYHETVLMWFEDGYRLMQITPPGWMIEWPSGEIFLKVNGQHIWRPMPAAPENKS